MFLFLKADIEETIGKSPQGDEARLSICLAPYDGLQGQLSHL